MTPGEEIATLRADNAALREQVRTLLAEVERLKVRLRPIGPCGVRPATGTCPVMRPAGSSDGR